MVGFKKPSVHNSFQMVPIPQSEEVLQEANVASERLREAMRPSKVEEVAMVLKRLSLHCGMPPRSPEEVKSMLGDYYHDLGEYPIALLEEAAESLRKMEEGSKYLPSSGKLISMMMPKYRKMQLMRKRIDQILGVYVEPVRKENKMMSLTEALNNLL